MSAYEKVSQRDLLEYHQPGTLHDPNAYVTYADGPYASQVYYDHGCINPQDADYHYATDESMNVTPINSHKALPRVVSQIRQPSFSDSRNASVQGHVKIEGHQENRLKRKASDTPQYDVAPPQKRMATAQLQVQDPNAGYFDASGQTSPYSPYIATTVSSASFQPAQTVANASRSMGHHYSTSTASQVSLAAPSPHTPVWSPSFATVKTEPSPRAPMTPAPRPASSSPLRSSIPRLVRTSTIHASSPAVTGPIAPAHPPNFNPYAIYPLKASLKLKGDLDTMTKNWNAKEIDCRRRLVEFKRRQEGSTISTDFHPVAPEDRAPSSITISCILWKEKNEYYVTSVDTIYLLEALVGVRFTVEEKNRIRRNLEGFRPATVSKAKTDSEEFFKVVMGFPHPKPRNIEKDVKVFPWKILAHALKKIISKYSASYSSTASTLLTPVASNYGGSENSGEFTFHPSPQPEYTTILAPYPVSHATGYPARPIPGRMSAPVTTAPLPELQLQVPTAGPPYEMANPYGFGAMPGMPQASMILTPEAMSAPGRVPSSWEFTNFVHDSPATAAPHSAPPMAYHRGPIDTADFVMPTGYQMR